MKFSYRGESAVSRFLGFSTAGIIEITLIALILSSEKKYGIFIFASLFLWIIFYLRKIIVYTRFEDNVIRVKFLYGKKICIDYKNIDVIYKNQEGFLPTYVYVVRLKDFVLKKITFYCSEEEYEKLKKFLLEIGLSNKVFVKKR